MEELAGEAPRLRETLEARITVLQEAAERIAGALGAPPPRAAAPLEDALRSVQTELNLLPPVLGEIQRIQAEAQRRAAAMSPPARLPPVWYDLTARAGRFRVAVNQWPQIEALVRQQVTPRRRKLVVAQRAGSMEAARAAYADDVFDQVHRVLNPLGQDPAAVSQGAYPDIGLPHSRFVALAHAAYRVGLARGRRDMRFLDVGCGMGLKLVAAARFFDRVAGIEMDSGYAGRARSFLAAAGLEDAAIAEGDARGFASYGDFDVVYLFRPLQDAEAMAGLEARIVAQLAPGALVLGPYKGLEARHRAAGLRRLAPGVFVAGLTAAKATALRRRAEYVGPAVRPPAEALSSVWTAILDASHANGHDLTREGRLDHV